MEWMDGEMRGDGNGLLLPALSRGRLRWDVESESRSSAGLPPARARSFLALAAGEEERDGGQRSGLALHPNPPSLFFTLHPPLSSLISQNADLILEGADKEDVAFLVVGDPFRYEK